MFAKIAERWKLTDVERARLLNACDKVGPVDLTMPVQPDLTPDVLDRISHLMSIYRSLRTLFPDAAVAASWLKRPNKAPIFGGCTALQKMSTGQLSDLAKVRQYLEAECG